MTEKDVQYLVYLRFGSLETTGRPIRGFEEIARIADISQGTIHHSISNYIARGNRHIDRRYFNHGGNKYDFYSNPKIKAKVHQFLQDGFEKEEWSNKSLNE